MANTISKHCNYNIALDTWKIPVVLLYLISHFTSNSMSSIFICFVYLLIILIYWVKLVLPTWTLAWDHPLGHGQPWSEKLLIIVDSGNFRDILLFELLRMSDYECYTPSPMDGTLLSTLAPPKSQETSLKIERKKECKTWRMRSGIKFVLLDMTHCCMCEHITSVVAYMRTTQAHF